MSEEIVWEDPPGDRRVTTKWVDLLVPLLEHLGEWGRIKEYGAPHSAYQAASHLRRGKVNVPEGNWEFQSGTKGGKGYLYARYLGPKEEKPNG